MIENESKNVGNRFWEVLLQEEDLFSEIGPLSCHPNLITSIESKALGSIDLEIKQCSFFGESYMSDTFFLTATSQDRTIHKAFGKVIRIIKLIV